MGYLFDGKYDCNGKPGIAGNFKVTYKGDTLTANIIWFVDPTAKLLAPAYNDISKGFLPISSGLIESEESFKEDMQRFIRSNKPYYAVNDKPVLICAMKLNFDEGGNITEDSEFDFYVYLRDLREKQDDGSVKLTIVCAKAITGPANEAMQLEHYDEKVIMDYISRIKKQLSKEVCQDRLSFLSYLVQDRKDF